MAYSTYRSQWSGSEIDEAVGRTSGDIVLRVNGRTGDVRLEAEDVGAVPQRLNALSAITGFRFGSVYVDNGTQGCRMSLESVKDLNTKILCVDNLDAINQDKITIDDYVYLKKEN